MGQDIGSFFNAFLESSSVFEDKQVFQPNFIPERVPHREGEIHSIAQVLAPALRGQRPSNLFIYGKTGTGKTLCTQYVASQLQETGRQRDIKTSIISVNCKLRRVADTEYRLIAELARQLHTDVPSTGLPTEEVYASFTAALESQGQVVILILDEIDHLVAKVGSGILYNLTRLNSQLKNAQISIVGISNDVMFTEQLDPRVKSSLSEEELVFPPYHAGQIKEILEKRALKAFKKGVLAPGVLEKCAACSAREHGDARRALELLRVAGELADRQGSSTVTLDHMDQAKEKVEHDRVEEVIAAQPKQYQAVLFAIFQLCIHRKDFLFTGEVYELYVRVCTQAGLRPLTQRRVSDIIGEFDMIGVIHAKIISKGRYGRTREIQVPLTKQVRDSLQRVLEQGLDLGTSKGTPDSRCKEDDAE